MQVDSVDYNTKLVIRPVHRGDSGEYTVTASNSSGKDTVTVNVVVTDKPTSPEGPLQVLQLLHSDWVEKCQVSQQCLFCARFWEVSCTKSVHIDSFLLSLKNSVN